MQTSEHRSVLTNVARVWRSMVVGCIAAGLYACAAGPTSAQSAIQEPGTIIEASDLNFDYYGGLILDTNIPTPESILGFPIGEHFIRHADTLRYLDALAAASPRVKIERYGQSHQRRDLAIVTISSPENLARLDDILTDNRKLADKNTTEAEANAIIERNPAIAWFSFSVHGNEASCTDAAVQLAYSLAAAKNPEVDEALRNVVLVIDPLLNPDGRERYVTWYENVAGSKPNPNPRAAEHSEPWPGGRSNHYLFDLNRDWLWLIHPESRSRLKVYRRYLPQLHIDHHEQEANNPFFFGAGADPYNLNIPAETREWIERYGQANAAVFDQHQRMYTTKERFDYLYPGYGKVLPVYHGAIGMLAEKGGHSRAGLALKLEQQNYTLTLRERARDHFLLAMSNLETTAAHRQAQLERFRRYHMTANEGPGPAAFIISADNDPARLARLWDLCESHGIEVHALRDDFTGSALHGYRHGKPVEGAVVPAGSWVIRKDQARGALAVALLERSTTVSTNRTYDITGWSLPIMFGLDAWYATESLEAPTQPVTTWTAPPAVQTGEGDALRVIDSSQFMFPVAVGIAAEMDLGGRYASEAFEHDGQRFAIGSLIVHRFMNREADFNTFESRVLAAGVNVHRSATGLTSDGPVLGAAGNPLFRAPRVLLLRGSPASSLSFGQIWHLLDMQMPFPHTIIEADDLSRTILDEHTVVIIPDGGGHSESATELLRTWVRGGGTLIAAGGGAASWAANSIAEVRAAAADRPPAERAAPDRTEGEAGGRRDSGRTSLLQRTFQERSERANIGRIPGPMLAADLDVTHPLAVGVGEWIGVIKRGGGTLAMSDSGYVVARFGEPAVIGGIISEENANRIAGEPAVSHHRVGSGAVICFSDDPTIRGFNIHASRLLMNAIVFGPVLSGF